MTIRPVEDDRAPRPASRYAQAIEVSGPRRELHVSGQVGQRPDGTLPEDWQGQVEAAWRNVLGLVEAAGMEATDLVEVFVILSDRAGLGPYREVRDALLGDHLTASTLMIGQLADPRWKIEIAAKAARIES